MKIAILADIHANLPALEAVLRDVEQSGADEIVFLGDIVGYGASPAECIELVRCHGGQCVMGNHDIAIKRVRLRGRQGMPAGWEQSAYFAGLIHAAERLNTDQAAWLDGLPFTLKIPRAIAAHANLHEPEGFESITDITSASPTLKKLSEGSRNTGFFGHTHLQEVFANSKNDIHWINRTEFHVPKNRPCAVMVGSVGQSRETDRLAAWVMWNPLHRVVEFRKTDYDRLRATDDITQAGLPQEAARYLISDSNA